MNLIFGVLYFIFGTIIGSFLNVVGLRYNSGRGIKGRSTCFSCGKELVWHELIPIFSFIFRFGRCNSCGSKISLQYPLIEFFTGLLFLGMFFKNLPLPTTVYFLTIFSILMVILIYDIRHKIVPDGLVYIFIVLSFLGLFFDFYTLKIIIPTLLEIFTGPIFFIPFFLVWFFSKGTWMGLGDAKLAAGIGWLLGFTKGFSAIVISFWLGAFVGLFMMFLPRFIKYAMNEKRWNGRLYLNWKQLTMKSEIAFAPFLIFGLLIVFFFNISVLRIFIGI